MSGPATRPTLEMITLRFRRELSRSPAPRPEATRPELEIRIQNVGYANFAAIYSALLSGRRSDGSEIDIRGRKLTQTVNAIMDARPAGRGDASQPLRPMKIREISFRDGKKTGERFARKEPLVTPFRVTNATGLSYLVALSAESDGENPFSSDAGAVIRVKSRVSFEMHATGSADNRPDLTWRVDMTITRQTMGSDAESSLQGILKTMFPPGVTPETLLAALRLDDDDSPAARQLYRYEVEIEFDSAEEVRDSIRPADITAAAAAILHLANPEYVREAAMQAEIYRTAQYIVKAPGYLRRFQNEFGLKKLLPQVLAITRADYRLIYPPTGMYLTEKADGKRAIAVVHDGRGVLVADMLHEFAAPAGAAPPPRGDTIADGELVSAGGAVTFYAFDVMVVAGEDLTAAGFEKRLEKIPAAVAALRAAGIPAEAKPYAHITGVTPAELAREIRAVHGASRPYEIDGLIFVEPGNPYLDTATYKWKPAEHNTIDMLARRPPPSVLGKRPFIDAPGCKLHFLFVGINLGLFNALGMEFCPGYSTLFGGPQEDAASAYFPTQFSPSDAPLAYVYQHPDGSPHGADIDGKVVEMRCSGKCAAAGGGSAFADWELTRVREDRARDLASKRFFGNDYHTAELIWLNYVDPFPLEQLWDGPGLDYFMRPKSGIYLAQTAATSFVKSQRIATLKHAACVVDVGAGKGQDLGRYLDAEVQHLYVVDRDRAALAELIRRKFNFARRRGAESAPGPRSKGRATTAVHALAADATEPFGATLELLENVGLARMTADALVCNLAVHYFLSSPEAALNFVSLARGVVKVGGQVILTVLVGERVHDTFVRHRIGEGGTWDVFESEAEGAPPTRKFSIKRLYASSTLEPAGQRIGVLLPFSDGQYYEENLVNVKHLSAAFAAKGFTREVSSSIARSLPEFETRNRAVASLLTAGDREWLAMYGELVFRRAK
jgi:hypothetical protein